MAAPQTSALAADDWELTNEPDDPKPGCLIVQLRQRAHVFPWFRFVYADGDNSKIEVAFASHTVVITGHGLAVLLAAISTQRVVRIIQPSENDAKFGVRGSSAKGQYGPSINNITVVQPIA